jgi:hypothetical protein
MQNQLILAFLLLPSLSYGQLIAVSGLKPRYKAGESLVFTIQNRSDSILFVSSFILQGYFSKTKEWYEVVHDISDNYPCNDENIENSDKAGHIVYPIKSGSARTIIWNPQKEDPTCFNYKKIKGKYRLLFIYRSNSEYNTKYYKSEFCITR